MLRVIIVYGFSVMSGLEMENVLLSGSLRNKFVDHLLTVDHKMRRVAQTTKEVAVASVAEILSAAHRGGKRDV